MMVDTIAQWASVTTGAVAAVLWLSSARVPIPLEIRHIDFGHAFALDDDKSEDDLDRMTTGLARQSQLSAWAAGFTAVSVAFLALHTALTT
jgi:hypothetical protein